ncbi:MAG: terminase TerL endonuclease subunit [Planctomycetota bacterium]
MPASDRPGRFTADQVVALANSLTFGDGPHTGQRLKLAPFQVEIIHRLCDPHVETGAVWIPKKNGKTMMAALLVLAELVHGLANNLSPEVYSASGTGKDQSALVFRAVAGFINNTPALQKFFWVRENIYKVESREKTRPGFYKCVVADGDKLDGPNPSLFVMDEIHRGGKRTQDIWDTLHNGMAQRPHPLGVSISTAGAYIPGSAAFKMMDRSRKVRDGVIVDPTFAPIIYEHTGPVPWDDGEDAMWSAYCECNPGAGTIIRESFIRSKIAQAIELPSKRPNFERFFMNVWTNEAETFMSPATWSENQEPFDLADLEGQPCYMGGDLAWVEDMCSIVLIFPVVDGSALIVPKYWIPGESLAERQRAAGAPFDQWHADGYLDVFAGGVTDFDRVYEYIEQCTKRFDVRGIAHDPVGTADIWKRCSDDLGLDVVKFSPKPWSMNEPTRGFESAVIEGQVQHNGHPVLAWNVANAMAKEDAEGQITLIKRSRHQNIDGLIAAILGHSIAKNGIEAKGKKRRFKRTDTEAIFA